MGKLNCYFRYLCCKNEHFCKNVLLSNLMFRMWCLPRFFRLSKQESGLSFSSNGISVNILAFYFSFYTWILSGFVRPSKQDGGIFFLEKTATSDSVWKYFDGEKIVSSI